MTNDQSCSHLWVKSGLWDGKDKNGLPTGGIIYKCQLCQDKAFSLEEINKKGGSVKESKSVFTN